MTPSLQTVLKRLRLSGILHTLPDRIAYAQKTKLSYPDLLELILQRMFPLNSKHFYLITP